MWIDTCCVFYSINIHVETCSSDCVIVYSSITFYVGIFFINSTCGLDWTSWASSLGHASYWLKSKVLKLSSGIVEG
jgi:hypothetical protein